MSVLWSSIYPNHPIKYCHLRQILIGKNQTNGTIGSKGLRFNRKYFSSFGNNKLDLAPYVGCRYD